MTAQDLIQIILSVIGGLGIFLLGMKNMSEGMQAVAGRRLRRLIHLVTNNRFVACGVGTGVTSLIQSSSVTTVMVVGMVSAGIMTLVQAIGVILGANIGTTITAWIITLKIGKYGLPILGVSAIFFLFSRNERLRYVAMMTMGLGMVFFGLELMKDGLSPLRSHPGFVEWFSKFQPVGYFGVLKCAAVGALLTAVVQSSSATIAITMGLASTGIIGYETAVALVLGENVGTTITAYLASLGATTTAKRAAYAHMAVNILGAAWITALFDPYIHFLKWMLGVDPGAVVMNMDAATYPFVEKGIATAHTMFNVVNVAIFLPFTGYLARLLERIVPERRIPEQPHLAFLDLRLVDTPAMAIEQSSREIVRMGDEVEAMITEIKPLIGGVPDDEQAIRTVFQREELLDTLQKEVVEFISHVLSGNVSRDVMEQARRQLRMADELESISDYASNLLKLRLKMHKAEMPLTEEGRAELNDLHEHVEAYVHEINQGVRQGNDGLLGKAHVDGKTITKRMKDYRSRHLDRVEKGTVSGLTSLIFTDMLNAYRRIKDHALNIAEVLSGEK